MYLFSGDSLVFLLARRLKMKYKSPAPVGERCCDLTALCQRGWKCLALLWGAGWVAGYEAVVGLLYILAPPKEIGRRTLGSYVSSG